MRAAEARQPKKVRRVSGSRCKCGEVRARFGVACVSVGAIMLVCSVVVIGRLTGHVERRWFEVQWLRIYMVGLRGRWHAWSFVRSREYTTLR